MTDETTGIIGDRRKYPFPGFTEDQSWALDVVAERTAERVLEKFFANGCPVPCDRVEALNTVTFGKREAGVVGLDQRMDLVEGAITRAARALWVAVSAIIVAVVGFLVSMLFGR